mgnify:CR=1 FL=1
MSEFERFELSHYAFTPDRLLKILPQPDVLDLFAYHTNHRTNRYAQAHPDLIVWSVGTEFGGGHSDQPHFGTQNYYKVNYGALSLS